MLTESRLCAASAAVSSGIRVTRFRAAPVRPGVQRGESVRWVGVGERTVRVSFLLRVVLPDKPGSLGAVATALGNAGADILGVNVVERSAEHAVDDLAVELPPGRPPDVLITAAEAVPGVMVESVRPHFGPLDTHHELELIEEVTGDPEHGTGLLARGVPRIFRAGCAWVVARDGD